MLDDCRGCLVCGWLPPEIRAARDAQAEAELRELQKNEELGEERKRAADAARQAEQELAARQQAPGGTPQHWRDDAELEPDQRYALVELNPEAGGRPEDLEEFERVTKLFMDKWGQRGRGKPRRIVSLRRVQNPDFWLRYEAQRNIVLQKAHNRGKTAETPGFEQLMFHGCKGNTQKVLTIGLDAQYGRAGNLRGTWLSTTSDYSGSGYHEPMQQPPNSRRMFIVRVTVGVPGRDDGSGKRPNQIAPGGDFADCHHCGDNRYVIYSDMQMYPEYLVHWEM